MAKLLLIVVVFALVYYVVRGYTRTLGRDGERPPAVKGGEDMVRCGHCGVHLPRSESVGAADAWFCSEEHRRLHES